MINTFKTILFVFLLTGISFPQFDPNPELEWFTIETEHFYVHYHTGTERTANIVAKIAEEVYGPITSLYKYHPKDKTSFIINDESDYSNGATDYFGNRIEIASANLDYDLRGTHNWLRNVITHEFTHVIQVPASFKFSNKVPSVYFQYIGYEKERRPDVLYGYPNVIVSYPFSGVGVPAWFAEGVAQYQRQQMGYDTWDSHRDMIQRMRSLGDNMLSWEDMGQFASVTSYKAESIYNLGFGLVRYIAQTYGENKLQEITDKLGNIASFNVESAFRSSIGKSGGQVYNEWKSFLKKDYSERVAKIKELKVEGDEVGKVGFFNLHPKFSPDTKSFAYLSNKEYDYGSTSLYLVTSGKDDEKFLIPSVSGGYNWSPDSKGIIFARRNTPSIHDKAIFDLYEFNIKGEKETQLTTNLRAHSPAYSPDGKRVCFVVNSDGTQNLYIGDNTYGSKLKNIKKASSYKNGEQVYNPVWSPDGKMIVFSFSKKDHRAIYRYHDSTSTIYPWFEDDVIDYRTPVFQADMDYLYFASDVTGIYNIYRYKMTHEMDENIMPPKSKLEQVTNVLGGAFMPSANMNGELVFANWTTNGYKINKINTLTDITESVKEKNSNYARPELLLSKYANETESNSTEAKNKYDWSLRKNFNDDSTKQKTFTKYNNVATPLFLIPVLRFETYKKDGKFLDYFKPGLYFYSQDVLGKMGIFGGAMLNKNLERDLFLQFDYNNGVPFFKDFFNKKLGFVPQFQIGGYNITRKTNADLVAGLDTIPIELTYDLIQFDFNMAFKIINTNHSMNFGFSLSRYSSKFNTFLIPGTGLQVPATSTNYFNGKDLSLTYTYKSFKPSKNDDISPVGRYFNLRYDYEMNELNPELSIDQNTGQVVSVFGKAKFHRLEADVLQNFQLFNSHSLGIRIKAGSILGKQQDNFFDFYASGYPGMKGYPFYAIGGSRYFTANLMYRFPVFDHIDMSFLQLYFDKLYFGIYGDVGNAWYGKATKLKDFKKDVGFELRLQAYSYYVYPTAFAFNAAYGIDQFTKKFPSTTGENKEVTYGKEWRFYFTMLFGFDFFVGENSKESSGFSKIKRFGL